VDRPIDFPLEEKHNEKHFDEARGRPMHPEFYAGLLRYASDSGACRCYISASRNIGTRSD